MVKVLTLVGDNGGCELWRTYQPMAELQRQGYRSVQWGSRDDASLADIAHLFDAIVIQRLHWQGLPSGAASHWINSLHRMGVAVIYEIDDDLFTNDFVRRMVELKGETPEFSEGRRRAVIEAVQLCDAMTVSSQRVATIARQYTDRPVKVVPNYIDLRWWKMIQKQAERKVSGLTIGWAGGNRLDNDMVIMVEAWARIAKRRSLPLLSKVITPKLFMTTFQTSG